MMKISQFLPKGVGVLFPEKPYLKRNNHPLPVKKRNPESITSIKTFVPIGVIGSLLVMQENSNPTLVKVVIIEFFDLGWEESAIPSSLSLSRSTDERGGGGGGD